MFNQIRTELVGGTHVFVFIFHLTSCVKRQTWEQKIKIQRRGKEKV